jgi:hypothetical protein
MTVMPTDSGAPVTWTVAAQLVTAVINAQGNAVPGYEIRFTLSNGLSDSVQVAATDYTVDKVKAAIAAKAALLTGVANLSGTVGTE